MSRNRCIISPQVSRKLRNSISPSLANAYLDFEINYLHTYLEMSRVSLKRNKLKINLALI